MTKQRKLQITVVVGEGRFTFTSVAQAKRFADKLAPSQQIAVELT